MKIKYYGHSCFKITSEHFEIVLDPYAPDSVPGLKDLDVKANLVLCSHSHSDHSYQKGVRVVYQEVNPCKITQLKCFHDKNNGKDRGTNVIHIIENEGVRIAHFGDLGHELSEELLKEIGHIDVALLPIGGYYTIDYVEAINIIEKLNPKTIIPMHYQSDLAGFEVIDTLDNFISHFSDITYFSSLVAIDESLPKIAVLEQANINI